MAELPHSCPNCGAVMTAPGPLETKIKRLQELSICCSCATDTPDGPNHAIICRECAKEMVKECDTEIERLQRKLVTQTDELKNKYRRLTDCPAETDLEKWLERLARCYNSDCRLDDEQSKKNEDTRGAF